jgi:hypothetical protein
MPLDLRPASSHRWSTWRLAPRRPGRRRRRPLQGEAKDLAVVDHTDSTTAASLGAGSCGDRRWSWHQIGSAGRDELAGREPATPAGRLTAINVKA